MKKKSWLCFYEYAPIFWNSGHGGGRSGKSRILHRKPLQLKIIHIFNRKISERKENIPNYQKL